MNTMTTVSEVLNHLKKEGYATNFNLQDNRLVCHGNVLQLSPDEFRVDQHYSFEGISVPRQRRNGVHHFFGPARVGVPTDAGLARRPQIAAGALAHVYFCG